MESNNTLQAGTATGTLLSIAPNILTEDILKTIILAVLGATVSFIVSLVLKKIIQYKK
ncbi:hypothetical protein [Flavobacterium sp. HJJ]|uniref:hypothetical protein n=1 Tax=Flavobacterium sp. HJJ TaxID=2783792 RepID=UPI00188D4313|nr:hypothetical protein [Flavobacterium sp. HJJ]MBF4471760.1 hypothetical protein [Flavobacterium sp. HJJ]